MLMSIPILLWPPPVLFLLPSTPADGGKKGYVFIGREKFLILWGSQKRWLFLQTGLCV